MGLNEKYDPIRNQILLMDSLPNVNKANSMILRVERQMEVQTVFNGENSVNELFVKNVQTIDKGVGDIHFGYGKKKDFIRKQDRKCSHCGFSGHTKDACFKLHGYLDRYKQFKESKSGGKEKTYANSVDASKKKESIVDEIPPHVDSYIQ